MNSNLCPNNQVSLCSRCREKPASMECMECDTKGLKLCYNCDITMHEFSFRNSHIRALVKASQSGINSNLHSSLTPRLQAVKPMDPMKGSITPRVRLQNEKKSIKNSENKENRGRNSSVGAFKRPVETKTITLVSKKIDPPPDSENAVNVMATKYQDLLSKKDQIIDSMRKTIDNLNQQLVQAQTNVKQSNTQISELKGVYNEDITKMKFKIKRLEEKRGHSSNQRASNVSADNKDYRNEKNEKLYSDQTNEIIKLRDQLAMQTKCYQQKYDALAKEKDILLNNLRVSKRLLESEEGNHKSAKERVKQLQVEIGSMKMAMGKLR